MTDTRDLDVGLLIDERDDATRVATRQIVAGVAELRDGIGRTPYITTVLNTVAELHQAIGRTANILEKAEHWLDVNRSVASASDHVDIDELLKDVRRDLKGMVAALEQQQRISQRSISRAWSAIAHRDGVVGRETW